MHLEGQDRNPVENNGYSIFPPWLSECPPEAMREHPPVVITSRGLEGPKTHGFNHLWVLVSWGGGGFLERNFYRLQGGTCTHKNIHTFKISKRFGPVTSQLRKNLLE